MKGLIILLSVLTHLLGLTLLKPAFADEHFIPKKTQEILILKSKESSYYNQTIHALKNTLSKESKLNIKNIHQNPKLNKANLIITLGKSAAIFARKNFPLTNKVMTFLDLNQSLNLTLKSNEIHLLIELPTKDYIKFAHTVLPNKRLGVLYQKSVTKLSDLFDNNLYILEVSRRNKIISATRDIIKSADALLALPNKDIFNRHSLKGILLSTYQNNTPLISYSPAHVKAGAVAAIFSSPSNLGEHTADIVQLMLTAPDFESKRHFAKYFSIKINQRVAQSLGLTLSNTDLIARYSKSGL